MTNNTCCLCGDEITKENDTNEHIIPNAVGGRLKVRGFICDSCNNTSGHSWDNALAKQMEQMCLLFNVKRERGSVQSLHIPTEDGNKIRFNPDGTMGLAKTSFSQKVDGRDIVIELSTNTVKEAKKILKGLKQKYPEVDFDKMLEDGKITSSYQGGNLRFSHHFGEEGAGKSTVKTAIAFAVHSGIDPAVCDVAVDYLTIPSSPKCFGHYYDGDWVLNRPFDHIFHCVHVTGVPTERLLLAYVEYFGFQRMIVCLSETYDGPEISHTYAIDPVTGEEVEIEVCVDLKAEQLQNCYSFSEAPNGAIEAMTKVIPLARQRHWDLERNRVVHRSVNHAAANCGVKEGEMFDEEGLKKFTDLMMEQLQPFVLRSMGVPLEHIDPTERPIVEKKPFQGAEKEEKKD